MGRPKALVEVGGATMAARAVGALRDAGADRVVLVGGDPAWAAVLGADHVADRWPGEGPLAGTATALEDAARWDRSSLVAVVACDQPWLTGPVLCALVVAVAADVGADVAVALTPDGRMHPFPAVWRSSWHGEITRLVECGARRADAGLASAEVVTVPTDHQPLADVDRPEDLPSER